MTQQAQGPALHHKDGSLVAVGDYVTDFRGERCVVKGWSKPHHEGSTGRVHVKCTTPNGDWEQSYYPSVFDLHWTHQF